MKDKKNLPAPGPAHADGTPSWFSENARKIYNEVVADLRQKGPLNPLDLPMVVMFCKSYANYIHCREEVKKETADNSAIREIMKEEELLTIKLANELGLELWKVN